MRSNIGIWAVALALGSPACGGDDDGSTPCENQQECEDDQTCRLVHGAGQCTSDDDGERVCTDSTECDETSLCDLGRSPPVCVVDPDPCDGACGPGEECVVANGVYCL